jgi:hypothetical protein
VKVDIIIPTEMSSAFDIHGSDIATNLQTDKHCPA